MYIYTVYIFFFLWRWDPTRVMASSFLRFLDHTQRRTIFGRTPLDKWSSSQRPLPDNTQHSQQTNIHAPGGIRTHDLSRRAAADLRLRPRDHWDRHIYIYIGFKPFFYVVQHLDSIASYLPTGLHSGLFRS
jgi:hypothetical protein